MPSSTHTRRTSGYTLTVPAPEGRTPQIIQVHLDALRDAVSLTGPIITGCWIDSTNGRLCVSYRAADDDTAAALAFQVLAAYDGAAPSTARMVTGYGTHRREFPLSTPPR